MRLFNRNKNNKQEKRQEQSEPLDEFTQQMHDAAEACVNHFEERYGKELDYSEASLALVDQILEEASDFYPEMADNQKKWIVNSVGAYIFEVARKNYGGKYFWFDQRSAYTGYRSAGF